MVLMMLWKQHAIKNNSFIKTNKRTKKLEQIAESPAKKYQNLQACKIETYWIWRWDERSSSWIPLCSRPDRCTSLRRPQSRDGSRTYWGTCRRIRSRSRWTSGWWTAVYWSLWCYWTWTWGHPLASATVSKHRTFHYYSFRQAYTTQRTGITTIFPC